LDQPLQAEKVHWRKTLASPAIRKAISAKKPIIPAEINEQMVYQKIRIMNEQTNQRLQEKYS
jgi:hypothetical protein